MYIGARDQMNREYRAAQEVREYEQRNGMTRDQAVQAAANEYKVNPDVVAQKEAQGVRSVEPQSYGYSPGKSQTSNVVPSEQANVYKATIMQPGHYEMTVNTKTYPTSSMDWQGPKAIKKPVEEKPFIYGSAKFVELFKLREPEMQKILEKEAQSKAIQEAKDYISPGDLVRKVAIERGQITKLSQLEATYPGQITEKGKEVIGMKEGSPKSEQIIINKYRDVITKGTTLEKAKAISKAIWTNPQELDAAREQLRVEAFKQGPRSQEYFMELLHTPIYARETLPASIGAGALWTGGAAAATALVGPEIVAGAGIGMGLWYLGSKALQGVSQLKETHFPLLQATEEVAVDVGGFQVGQSAVQGAMAIPSKVNEYIISRKTKGLPLLEAKQSITTEKYPGIEFQVKDLEGYSAKAKAKLGDGQLQFYVKYEPKFSKPYYTVDLEQADFINVDGSYERAGTILPKPKETGLTNPTTLKDTPGFNEPPSYVISGNVRGTYSGNLAELSRPGKVKGSIQLDIPGQVSEIATAKGMYQGGKYSTERSLMGSNSKVTAKTNRIDFELGEGFKPQAQLGYQLKLATPKSFTVTKPLESGGYKVLKIDMENKKITELFSVEKGSAPKATASKVWQPKPTEPGSLETKGDGLVTILEPPKISVVTKVKLPRSQTKKVFSVMEPPKVETQQKKKQTSIKVFQEHAEIKPLPEVRLEAPAFATILKKKVGQVQSGGTARVSASASASLPSIASGSAQDTIQIKMPDVAQASESTNENRQSSKLINIFDRANDERSKPIKPLEQIPQKISLGFPTMISKPKAFFKTLVRRQGQFKSIGIFPTEKAAVLAGKERVSHTAAASFKVMGNLKGIASKLLQRKQFYSSKKEPGVYIERREKRIKSPGEKFEITRRGILASGIARERLKNKRRRFIL